MKSLFTAIIVICFFMLCAAFDERQKEKNRWQFPQWFWLLAVIDFVVIFITAICAIWGWLP